MTPEEKQSFLQRTLPEIAKACGFHNPEWIGPLLAVEKYGEIPKSFDPVDNDKDSALVRRVFEISVIRFDKEVLARWIRKTTGDIELICHQVAEPHDGTPDSIGAAERLAVLRSAAKKLGLWRSE